MREMITFARWRLSKRRRPSLHRLRAHPPGPGPCWALTVMAVAEWLATQVQSHVSRLEEMLRVRDEGLGAAVEGVEAMRADRASMRDASLAALERLSLAETQLREAVKERDDTEYRLGEEIVVLEQQLKQASTYLNIEKESHAENLKAATALREELHAVKKAAADTEKELRTRVAVQSAQIQELEEEIEDLHHSAMELEALLVEQQTTLDRLVDTTLSEVCILVRLYPRFFAWPCTFRPTRQRMLTAVHRWPSAKECGQSRDRAGTPRSRCLSRSPRARGGRPSRRRKPFRCTKRSEESVFPATANPPEIRALGRAGEWMIHDSLNFGIIPAGIRTHGADA